jgi:hypothetical protein
MEPLSRIELETSFLPRKRSATELQRLIESIDDQFERVIITKLIEFGIWGFDGEWAVEGVVGFREWKFILFYKGSYDVFLELVNYF